ncbi:MAG: hypothetical protein IJA62_03915 [Ruminococcus sp.]|nr:hypothetical protein [Ruminococcus sp.]
MPNISVDTRKLRTGAASMRVGAVTLGICAASVENARNSLPFSEDIVQAINRVLTSNSEGLWYSRDKLLRMADAVMSSAELYEHTENSRCFVMGIDRIPSIMYLLGIESSAARGDGALSGSVVSGSIGGSGSLFGMSLTGLASGSLLNYNISGSTGYGLTTDENGNIESLGITAEGEISANLAQGSLTGTIGLLTGTASGQVGSVSVRGETGLTIFEDGNFVPALYANLRASASLLSGAAGLTFGNEIASGYANANGEVLSAEAYANGAVGAIRIEDENGNVTTQYGVQGKVGAEAYVAQGTLSGGFELFGVRFNGSVTGSVGGAGVSAGGSITTGGVSGTLGAGLGAGGNVSFSIDWSGFDGGQAWDTISSAGENIGEWMEGVGENVDDWFEDAGEAVSGWFK